MSSLPDDTQRHLHRAALRHQREGRVPGLAAAVVRSGELLWFAGIGTTRVGSPETPGPDHQYLVGSHVSRVLGFAWRVGYRHNLMSHRFCDLQRYVT